MSLLLKGFCVVLMLCCSVVVYASTEQFSISQSVINTDASPPTAPSTLIANGVALTQVTLSWGASTDAVGVAGYQIFRDGIQIATSAALTYNDTGLSPATSYGYFVTAFDSALNISAASAVATGTTLSVVVTATTSVSEDGGAVSGGRAALQIANLQVVVSDFSAKLSWRTTIQTKSLVRWGRTPEYEIASLREDSHNVEHATHLSDLEPGTKYYYTIIAQDGVGRETVLVEDFFITQNTLDESAPPNVRELRVYRENGQNILTWNNPEVSDFDKVRIVRRWGGYPSDPFDGEIVYEGDKERYQDSSLREPDGVVYYAVFSYDIKGNVSSGALVRIVWGSIGIPLVEEISPYASSTLFRFQDLIFIQRGKKISYIGETVPINSSEPLSIQIPYDSLPKHLKTILVTLEDVADPRQTFSFLLRVNRDETFYEAVIDSLMRPGSYNISVAIFDYKERTISKAKGQLLAKEGSISDSGDNALGVSSIEKIREFIARLNYTPWILSLSLLLVVLYLLVIDRSSRKEPPG